MTVVDAEGSVRAWVNGNIALTGEGNPLPLGAHLQRLRSPARGAYLLLTRVGGLPALTAENPVDQARLSAAVYAGTKEAAEAAARAYVNALLPLHIGGSPAVMGEALCLGVASISGPLYVDDHDTAREQWRYLVDAELLLTPAA